MRLFDSVSHFSYMRWRKTTLAATTASWSVERILSEVGGDLVGTTALPANAVSHEIELESMRSSGSDLILMGLRGDRQAAYVERYSNSDFSEPLAIVDPAAATLARLDGGALAVDVYWPVMWHHSLFRYSARELNSRHFCSRSSTDSPSRTPSAINPRYATCQDATWTSAMARESSSSANRRPIPSRCSKGAWTSILSCFRLALARCPRRWQNVVA